MKSYKKWATASVALSIVGVLVGCGNANRTTGGTTPTNTTNHIGSVMGNAQIIHLASPIPNQTVQAGSQVTVSGTVAKGFENQTLRVQLLSGDVKPSKIIQTQEFQVGSDGKFSGQFRFPNNLPSSGTKMAVMFELLMKGGPEVSTTLTAKQR